MAAKQRQGSLLISTDRGQIRTANITVNAYAIGGRIKFMVAKIIRVCYNTCK